jgi:hypothetical protein
MKFTISTLEEPFAFFEGYIVKDGINKHLSEYIEKWVKLEKSNPSRFKVLSSDDYCTVHETYPTYIIPEDGSNEERVEIDEVITYRFAETSEEQLKHEVLISKKLIKEISKDYLKKFNDSSNILSFHSGSLSELIRGSENILTKFPFCIDHLNTLSQYIQDLSYNISNATIEFNPKSDSAKNNDEPREGIDDPYIEILGYLKGENEFGQKIMSDNAFTKLVESIAKVIKNEKVELDYKFDLKEKNGVLKYTFYVLHLRLIGTKKNDLFYKFIHGNILQFQGCDYKPFKSKISDPPSYLPNYIPSIIKEQRQRQMSERK